MANITQKLVTSACTSEQYTQLFQDKVKAGATTGTNQSAAMLEYTALNWQRTTRIAQHLTLTDGLKARLDSLPTALLWLVITEIWCGDTAQSIPYMQACAAYSPQLEVRFILRDEHPDVMDNYLGEGGSRAIPVVICLEADTLKELGHWGPRPEAAQQIVRDHKANPTKPTEQMYADLHLWYSRDKGQTLQQEFEAFLTKCSQNI